MTTKRSSRHRLKVYEEETAPLIAIYHERGIVRS